MNKNLNEVIKKRYNRISGIYELMDRMIKEEWRKNLLSQATGKVLEVGIGTGANMPYYREDLVSLTGIDFSRGMLTHAIAKNKQGSFSFPIDLIEGDIQELPFPDEMFDSIVSTCVFCSVPDPVKGLKELRRVCKPTGSILMLEHMRSENKLVSGVMDVLNPLTVRLWGANINRETLKNIELSNLKVESNKPLMSSILRELTISPCK